VGENATRREFTSVSRTQSFSNADGETEAQAAPELSLFCAEFISPVVTQTAWAGDSRDFFLPAPFPGWWRLGDFLLSWAWGLGPSLLVTVSQL
jgi:hypothetical protein